MDILPQANIGPLLQTFKGKSTKTPNSVEQRCCLSVFFEIFQNQFTKTVSLGVLIFEGEDQIYRKPLAFDKSQSKTRQLNQYFSNIYERVLQPILQGKDTRDETSPVGQLKLISTYKSDAMTMFTNYLEQQNIQTYQIILSEILGQSLVEQMELQKQREAQIQKKDYDAQHQAELSVQMFNSCRSRSINRLIENIKDETQQYQPQTQFKCDSRTKLVMDYILIIQFKNIQDQILGIDILIFNVRQQSPQEETFRQYKLGKTLSNDADNQRNEDIFKYENPDTAGLEQIFLETEALLQAFDYQNRKFGYLCGSKDQLNAFLRFCCKSSVEIPEFFKKIITLKEFGDRLDQKHQKDLQLKNNETRVQVKNIADVLTKISTATRLRCAMVFSIIYQKKYLKVQIDKTGTPRGKILDKHLSGEVYNIHNTIDKCLIVIKKYINLIRNTRMRFSSVQLNISQLFLDDVEFQISESL